MKNKQEDVIIYNTKGIKPVEQISEAEFICGLQRKVKEDIIMKETSIIFSWKENGKDYQKEISREHFYAMFDGLEKGFKELKDNEISKKMCKVIPEVDKIFINKDHNETQDIPFVICYINNTMDIIKIMRRHKIVWSILDKYCTE